ncbi:uncharacterized protein [Palaemon carinicauda]|uniref:uncharacterized protein n=1 Tax=Palaemon carinicauda TaxID=392227 RepID=UPI0035B6653F
MSFCKDCNWFTHLPWVLPELSTTPKDTLDVLSGEMVYVDPLVVPGSFFPSPISSDNLQYLSQDLGKFTSSHQTYKPPAKQHIPTYLHSETHVFLRNDISKPSVMYPYPGPFMVICHMLKAFCIDISGIEDWVSIDCLNTCISHAR